MRSETPWLLLLLCAFGAEVVGTMAGFGAATVLTPIAAMFIDMKTAIAVVACFHLFGNASRPWFFGRHINWTVWAQFGLTGVIFSLLGAHATTRLASSTVKILCGLFLLPYVWWSSVQEGSWKLPAAPATLLAGGTASGFIAGLIGTGGAIRSACLLAFGHPKEVYIGTSAAIALIVDATRLPVYLAQHLIPASLVALVGSLVVAAFLGAWVGRRLVQRISSNAFRRIVTAMLFFMGLKLLWDGWTQAVGWHGMA